MFHLALPTGYEVNPCRSPLHPSVTEAGIEPDGEDELSVQVGATAVLAAAAENSTMGR